jgi:hypothetical protein
MTDVGDPYFELQTSTKYLLFKFLHTRGYLSKVCRTGHFLFSAVPSYIAQGTVNNSSVPKPNCDFTESILKTRTRLTTFII